MLFIVMAYRHYVSENGDQKSTNDHFQTVTLTESLMYVNSVQLDDCH